MAFKKGHKFGKRFQNGSIPWNKGNGEYMKGEKNHFYGKKHSETTRKKIKELLKGKDNSGQFKFGHKHSLETIKKISDKRKGIPSK